MSVVVAIKDEDRVWMACDSQVSRGYTKKTLTNKNNYKICRPKDEKETLVGLTGRAKALNVLQIQDRFIDELSYLKGDFNFKYMVEKLVPNLFRKFKDYELIIKEKDQEMRYLDGGIVFAHKNNLFTIDPDGFVTEIDDFCADGSGDRLCLGYLNQSKGEDIKDRIVKAIKSACEGDLYVNYPIIVMNTLDDEIIVVEQ